LGRLLWGFIRGLWRNLAVRRFGRRLGSSPGHIEEGFSFCLGARHRMSLISAITARGHMRFMIKEKGGVNAEVFIEFLKRLITGVKRPIILIVDRGPAHIAKKTKVFVERLNGKLRLYYLPPYSPDRHRRPHGDHRQGRFSNQSPFIHASTAKRLRKNPLLLPKTVLKYSA
jgi:hypothetical protein